MKLKLFHRSTSRPPLPRFFQTLVIYGLERDTMVRSLKATVVIGTLLGLINHGQALVEGRFTSSDLVPLMVTYLVPFCVTTYGQIQGKSQRDRLWREKSD